MNKASDVGLVLDIIEKEAASTATGSSPRNFAESRIRRMWTSVARAMTVFVPEQAIPALSPQGKLAWKEKLTLCMLFGLFSGMLLSYLIWLPSFLCPVRRIMSVDEIVSKPAYNPHVIIHGKVFDFTRLAQKHNQNAAIPHHIFSFAGKDASHLFPRPHLPEVFNTLRKRLLESAELGEDVPFIPYYHSHQDLQIASGWPDWYDVCHDWDAITGASTRTQAWIVLHGEVIDITALMNEVGELQALGMLDPETAEILNDKRFMGIVSAPWGRDKSDMFRYQEAARHYNSLLRGYVIGVIDSRESVQCVLSSYLMIGSTALMVLVILVKFFASLQLGIKGEPEKLNKYVVAVIPCYTEDQEGLHKTIESVVNLNYDNRKKVMFVVADGYVTGRGNSAPTPDYLKRILKIQTPPRAFEYLSISSDSSGINMAEVYFGFYPTEEAHPVPFVLVVKTGSDGDTGNRGKRDSQLILLRFLSRANFNLPMCPLELELYRGFLHILRIDPTYLEFVLMVDADTAVFSDALNRLLACCVHDSRIIGICGETRIKNEKTSWITMIQVYEYFISHHMSKAFESLFGCVTCLPGCFCMYRLKNSVEGVPLLIKPDLLDDYAETDLHTLHQRNLLSLGEDRYLTTLVLKHFPKYRTKFTSDAVCKTVVPETWTVLLSQRRRWINSTIHNLFELLLLQNLCGFCLFSMRFIIFMDLFSTIILPATVVYMMHLFVKSFQEHVTAKISLFMLSSVYGLQMLVFILKKQWQHIGWMAIYICALPLFGFFIPLYSFWHFDDFTWGSTRRTKGDIREDPAQQALPVEPQAMMLKTWEEFSDELQADVPLAQIDGLSAQNCNTPLH